MKKVLVVDNSATMRVFLKEFLEESGLFEVIVCEDNMHAVQHIAVADALIASLDMGDALAGKARCQRPNMPILLMVGTQKVSNIQDTFIITRPINHKIVLSWLRKVTK